MILHPCACSAAVWFCVVAASMGVVAVFALNDEYKSVHKEIKNGMISPLSYLFAKAILEVPVRASFQFVASDFRRRSQYILHAFSFRL
jgi:hypothetical protein